MRDCNYAKDWFKWMFKVWLSMLYELVINQFLKVKRLLTGATKSFDLT